MSFVDRYWEWKRRCALRASLRSQERTRELELVAKVIMERRGVNGPSFEGQAPPVYRSPAAFERSARKARQRVLLGKECPGDSPSHQTGGHEQLEANGSGYSTILVAVDGTSPATEVGAHAVRLAQSLGAKLFALGFVNVRMTSRMGVYRFRALAELERESREAARQTEEIAQKSGVECEVRRALDPHPSRAIVAAAEEVGADCIMIGSPSASVVEHALDRVLGGVYGKVLREAGCPVLSI